MATVPIRPQFTPMNAAAGSKLRFSAPRLRGFCILIPSPKSRPGDRSRVRVRAPVSDEELKENWLDSLSCPFRPPEAAGCSGVQEREEGGAGKWVLGIDPDSSGALALLKDDGDDVSCSAQVFDSPHLQVLVGKRVRKRLDARSIVQLLHSLGAPLGTQAYIEQSSPFPQDGKQGWWSGGFTYGMWIGILVSSGFSVVPVSSRLWKDQFQLFRNSSSKDDSRKAASDLFPSLSSALTRKKDHGRADALLIAAYGKGLRIQSKPMPTCGEASAPNTHQHQSPKGSYIEEHSPEKKPAVEASVPNTHQHQSPKGSYIEEHSPEKKHAVVGGSC